MSKWIMAEEKTSLSPRETAMRMLLHVDDDVSYEDIIRQLRILQQIDRTMEGRGATAWLEQVIPEASPEPFQHTPRSGSSPKPSLSDLAEPARQQVWANDAFDMGYSAAKFSASLETESADYAPYPSGLPSLVLRSRQLYSWRTLAERSDDLSDFFLGSATWIY